MAEEIVDVVDENNTIIDQVTKQEAHQNGLLHRTVISQIYDTQRRWILVKQASDRQDAGQWVSPVGGHVRHGETEEDALKREALEETGLKDFDFKLKGRVIFNREVLGRKESHYFILYEIYSDDPITLNEESVEFKAFTKDFLKQEIKQHPERFGAAFYAVIDEFYPELRI
jgi:isopentenyl-diphosphate Delta-isomerase